jgi:lipopolysaccharide biosynthesis glycosyltransferase
MTAITDQDEDFMIRVFIGYDWREAVAFHALSHSIHSRASKPVSIVPVMLSQLTDVFTRERNPLQSTDFSFSRFLAPYLAGYRGWALFMDCDMIMREDIAQLWELRDDRYSVMCVKHDHRPSEERKFLGETQTKYEKKNWSSVMLFNCEKCTALTPDYVNTATGLELHQFKWLESEGLIGELPAAWNHLVGYDPPRPDAAVVHYTSGGPWFDEYRDCEYADEWFAERDAVLFAGEGDSGQQSDLAPLQASVATKVR